MSKNKVYKFRPLIEVHGHTNQLDGTQYLDEVLATDGVHVEGDLEILKPEKVEADKGWTAALSVALGGVMEIAKKGIETPSGRGYIEVELYVEGQRVNFTKIMDLMISRLDASVEQRAVERAKEMLAGVDLQDITDMLAKAKWDMLQRLNTKFPHLNFHEDH